MLLKLGVQPGRLSAHPRRAPNSRESGESGALLGEAGGENVQNPRCPFRGNGWVSLVDDETTR